MSEEIIELPKKKKLDNKKITNDKKSSVNKKTEDTNTKKEVKNNKEASKKDNVTKKTEDTNIKKEVKSNKETSKKDNSIKKDENKKNIEETPSKSKNVNEKKSGNIEKKDETKTETKAKKNTDELKEKQKLEDKKELEKKKNELDKDDTLEAEEGSLLNLVKEELNKNSHDVEEKIKRGHKKGVIIFIIFFLIGFSAFVFGCYYFYHGYLYEGLEIKKIEESKNINEDNTKTINIYIDGNVNTQCSIDGKTWKNIDFGKCSFDVESGTYHILVKNDKLEVEDDYKLVIDELKSLSFNVEELYIAIGEKYKPVVNMEYIGVSNETLKWSSSDDNIATVDEKGIVTGIKEGNAVISVEGSNGIKAELTMYVTKLLVKPVLNDKKSVVKCNQYTDEENEILDKALFNRVKDKGEGTRAALIEVSRFLTLSFEYKIPYFYENGRMDYPKSGIRKADGEGRYYHKGLYLSKSKLKDIKESYKGPSIWGCPLTNLENHGKYKPGAKMPNGLDCSGYVSWCLYNSGTDVGDIGAGINDNVKEMSDVGEMNTLNYDFVNSGEVKVGDIIARWGHTALIAGMDDTYIYISESLLKGVRIEKYKYKDKGSVLYTKGWYTYINKMDNVYKADGEYTNMWLNAEE